MLNEDYKEILQILLDGKVKFLVVGAYAMGAYGYPRAPVILIYGLRHQMKIKRRFTIHLLSSVHHCQNLQKRLSARKV